jgi:hypothetical protein
MTGIIKRTRALIVVGFDGAEASLIAMRWAVPLAPWAPGERDQFVTITTEVVEGRRVSRAAGSTDQGRSQAGAAHDHRQG